LHAITEQPRATKKGRGGEGKRGRNGGGKSVTVRSRSRCVSGAYMLEAIHKPGETGRRVYTGKTRGSLCDRERGKTLVKRTAHGFDVQKKTHPYEIASFCAAMGNKDQAWRDEKKTA